MLLAAVFSLIKQCAAHWQRSLEIAAAITGNYNSCNPVNFDISLLFVQKLKRKLSFSVFVPKINKFKLAIKNMNTVLVMVCLVLHCVSKTSPMFLL